MDWQALRNKIKGTVATPSDLNFASILQTMVWNKIKPNRSPDVIVAVKNDQDIVESIHFARKNRLKISVHGGGHTWCGLAVRNGGMIIDLSQLNEVKIDASTQTAIIQPVISNRDLAEVLGQHHLAFPIGHCPTVKAGGYLLNGGMSWNMSQWGPACMSVKEIEFVTADGKKIKANREEHSDLFWAARGCGPGMFAVATRFHLNCYPLPSSIMSSNYYYSLDDLPSVAEEVVTLGKKMPSSVELSIFLISAPHHLAKQCKNKNGKICLVSAVAFAYSEKESKDALEILEKSQLLPKSLYKSIYQPSSFKNLADIAAATFPEDHRNLCENQCSEVNPVEIVIAFKEKIIEAPSSKSLILFCQSTGGHNLLQPSPEVALSMSGQSYGGIWTIWEKQNDDKQNYKWHNECTNILKKFTSQHYIGETDIVQNPAHILKSYHPEKWKKLEQIRSKYDPEEIFFGFNGI